MADVAPDQEIVDAVASYDARAKEYADSKVGFGFNLLSDEIFGPILSNSGRSREEIFRDQVKVSNGTAADSAEVDLITRTMLFYSGADICSFQTPGMNISPLIADITHSELFRVMKYNNNLMVLWMNGAQLKKYMEWSAAWFVQMTSETDAIARDTSLKGCFYDVFQGVSYRINLAKPAGERIRLPGKQSSAGGGRTVQR